MARRVTTIMGLLLALGMPLAGPARFAHLIPGVAPEIGREICWWTLALFILFWVLIVERRGLGSIGWKRPDWKTFAFGIGGGAVILVLFGVVIQMLFRLFHLQMNADALRQLTGLPFALRVALVTRAAFVEEILFRGYGIERLAELTGSRWLAGLVTLGLFTYAHIAYWGIAHVIVAGVAGLALTLLYLWRRDLTTNIIAHWIVDGVGLLARA
jgi:membrane protease YdiL (CAAX protease family)